MDFNDVPGVLHTAGANAILNIVDSAPVFVDIVEDPARLPKPSASSACRARGRAGKRARGRGRGARADAVRRRTTARQLAAAGALQRGFARAALEEAASACGLIRDDGLRAVKSAIAAG